MPLIVIQTEIDAPIDRVFDLSRSIDLHKISTAKSNEEVVAGRTSGLINLGESVTWRARHFGITQLLTSQITSMFPNDLFVDEMVSGAFKRFQHAHIFLVLKGKVLMTDRFDYTSPYGVFGKIADFLFLKKYMTKLLMDRNKVIKEFAETEKWKAILSQ